MNIVIKPYGSDSCYCRPDTTWERENKDYYVPESIDSICWTPIVFVRISKAGKCIGKKFVSRYYDAFNFGALLYTGDGETAFTSCADHTSLLPSPLYNTVVMENADNGFVVSKDGEAVFETRCGDISFEDAICKASELTSLRIGDYVAVELAPKMPLGGRNEGNVSFKATFCENEIFNLQIIY